MPRDGSNIYSQPFPDVVEDTTIESTVYNGFTNDIAADLNAARPIVAGGTGATSAGDARFNLTAETAAQLVTNYDSHLWTPGSFQVRGRRDWRAKRQRLFWYLLHRRSTRQPADQCERRGRGA